MFTSSVREEFAVYLGVNVLQVSIQRLIQVKPEQPEHRLDVALIKRRRWVLSQVVFDDVLKESSQLLPALKPLVRAGRQVRPARGGKADEGWRFLQATRLPSPIALFAELAQITD